VLFYVCTSIRILCSFHSTSIYIYRLLFFLLKCLYHYNSRRIVCWCCVPHSTLSSSFAFFTLCCSISFHSASIYSLSSCFFFLLKCIYHYSERHSICWCCVHHSTLSSSLAFDTVLFDVCSSIRILCSLRSASNYILLSFLSVLLQCIYHYSERRIVCWCCVHHLTLSSSFAFDTVLFFVCSSIRILCSFRSASNCILTSFLSVLLKCIYHYSERHSICWCYVHHLTLSSSFAFWTSMFVEKTIYLSVLCASFSVFFYFCLSTAVFMGDTIDLCVFRLCFALLHC
jgi:hypothetical protein